MAAQKLSSINLRCLSVLKQSAARHFEGRSLPIPSQCLVSRNIMITSIRHSSYKSSKPEGPSELYTNVDITANPAEWKFVERLLPPLTVPQPIRKSEYPSGWKFQEAAGSDLPYFVERTKNHMVPVYLQQSFRGMSKVTQVRKVQGDIWEMERDLLAYLQKQSNKKILTQVHEMNCQINVKGDYVHLTKEWVLSKGF